MIFIDALLAPAVLISAAGLLVMGTGNRYGRIVDRVRLMNQDLLEASKKEVAGLVVLRDLFAMRAKFAWIALFFLHSGILCFVSASLFLGIGTHYESGTLALVGEGLMFFGVGLLGCGSINMVREAQITFETTRKDIERTSDLLEEKDRA